MARRKNNSSLTHTAESLGTALGQVAARLDAWKKQRADIAAEIHQLLDSAKGLLGDLRDTSVPAAAAKNKGGRPKGYQMSEETKKKLRAAWKRRKAAVKPAKDKVAG